MRKRYDPSAAESLKPAVCEDGGVVYTFAPAIGAPDASLTVPRTTSVRAAVHDPSGGVVATSNMNATSSAGIWRLLKCLQRRRSGGAHARVRQCFFMGNSPMRSSGHLLSIGETSALERVAHARKFFAPRFLRGPRGPRGNNRGQCNLLVSR